MLSYGELLKNIIGFTGVKMSALADSLGYDISYISKWCNQSKLPGAKTANETNRSLARIFAGELEQSGDTKRFADSFHLSESIDTESGIYTLLHEAYRRSSASTSVTETESNGRETRILTKYDDIHSFFVNEFPTAVSESDSDSEILITLDLCTLLDMPEELLPELSVPKAEISVSIGISKDTLLGDSTYLTKFYGFLNRYNTVYFDLYENSFMPAMNLIVVKNRFAVLCSLYSHGRVCSCVIAYDRETVQQLYITAKEAFRRSRLMFHSTAGSELELHGYRTSFYSKDSFQIFSAKGFEYLLPQKCWDTIYEFAKEKDDGGFAAHMTEVFRIVFEENFEKGNLKFFIPKSILLRYMEDGEIIFFDFPYYMSANQRKEQMHNVLKMSDKNPNLLFYVIDEDRMPAIDQHCGITIYNNREDIFAKNLWHMKTGRGPKLYYVDSKELVREIGDFFDSLGSNPNCTEYDSEGLHRVADRFGTLISRMLDING